MENSTKALIMVAAMFIGVMILMILLYMFNLSANIPAQYERTKQDEMILAFNAKFEKYALVSDENSDGKLSVNEGATEYKYELNMPSNSFSDVISACNLVNDINTKNEFDSVNGVTVEFEINGKTYSISPERGLAEFEDNGGLKKNKVFMEPSGDVVDLFDLMNTEVETGKFLSDVKYWEGHKIRYRYYFDAILEYGLNENEVRNFGKVVKITFTLKETEDFDTLP